MHCPCFIFSAMCNYEDLNLFIPQALPKSLAAVGSDCGREGRGRCLYHHPSRVQAVSHNIFAQENEFIKINQCVLKKETAFIADIEQNRIGQAQRYMKYIACFPLEITQQNQV